MAELLDFTKPHVLRNEAEYTAAVAEIDQLLDTAPPPHSEAYERLEFLSVLVQAYEEAHFPLSSSPPRKTSWHLCSSRKASRTLI